MSGVLRLFAVIVLALLVAAGGLAAQEVAAVNYTGWDRDAARAEEALSESRASNNALEQLRTQIVTWREKFAVAETSNAARIETVQTQIAALGPPPAEGATEAPQIASRRAELAAQLAELQAPQIAAAEARGRADGIIREIDRIIRERQADALLRLSPTPMNPVHWPAALAVFTQGVKTLWVETVTAWDNPARRVEFRNNIPVIILYIGIAGLLLARGPGYMERLTRRLQRVGAMRARNVAAALVSLGQVAVPYAGTLLLVAAIEATGMTGLRSGALIASLPIAAFAFFAARWLSTWLFQTDAAAEGESPHALTDRPVEGRFLASTIGLIVAVELLRRAFTTEVRPPLSMAAQAVWLAPVVVLVSVFVFRLGLLLRQKMTQAGEAGEAVLFRNRLIGLTGTVAAGIAVLAPVLALVGYVAAANALIWPTVMSLALIGLVILLQRFATDIYLAITRGDETQREALIPVLAGFLLTLCALPVFALIWGARVADLWETWTRFREGISIGETRISPLAFLTFAAVFALGYMVTRLVQGALKSSVLPRTRIDRGAQNAVAAGVGYLGIFLAALVAINAAGLDLSSLAIVAGALSVGIGFGLQNIVSNFVSGIILLIERPISEGDAIEVGTKSGTVKGISVRSTRIETLDRTTVIIPNADLVSGVVTNLSRFSKTGRLVMQVGVAEGADTRKVQGVLLEIAEAQPTVMVEPKPSVGFLGFANGALVFEMRMILADVNLKPEVQSEINHQIAERFAAEGISYPRQRREVWVSGAEEEPVAAEVPTLRPRRRKAT